MAGAVALISRGTCEFGLKSALAGATGADAASIYNNVEGPLAGTLGAPPRSEGDYVPTAGISLADGTALAAAIDGGAAVTPDVNIESIQENRTTYAPLLSHSTTYANTNAVAITWSLKLKVATPTTSSS